MENDEKNIKIEEPTEANSYYDKKPEIGRRGPSKIRQYFSKGMTYFLVVAASIVFYFAFLRFTNISNVFIKVFNVLKPILYGLVIAYLLNPIVKRVEKVLIAPLSGRIKKGETAQKIARGIGIGVALVVLITIVVTLCNMVLPELYFSIRNMIFTVPDQLNEWLHKFNTLERGNSTLGKIASDLLTEGTNYFQTWLSTDLLKQTNILMSNVTVGVLNVVRELLNVVIGLIVSVYVLFSKEVFSQQCKKCVYAFLSPDHANLTLHLTQKSNDIFGGFIIGKIIDSLIIGVLCFISLSILKMPYTVLVSVIVGVTNVIPFFGPYIGAIPSAILIMLDSPIKGVYFIIFIFILQQIDGNIIGPKILGDSTGLSAFWVVFSILLGGGMFGFVGMIMGVPTFAVLYYIIQIIVNQKLEKKKLPTHSENYNQKSYVSHCGTFVGTEEFKNSVTGKEEKDANSSTK
ncbi:MAG: AI-2E family transporter [Lachnospiraceae bacterium]